MPYKTRISPNRKSVVWDYNTVFGASAEFRCYQLSDQHIQALLAVLTAMQWRTRWTDSPDDMSEIIEFVGELAFSLMMPVDCGADCPQSVSPSDSGSHSAVTFEQLLEILMEVDVKFSLNGQLYEPAIPLVPCGCGEGDDGQNATSTPALVPGSSGSGDYGAFATLCDALGVLPAYIDTEMGAFLDRVQEGAIVTALLAPELIPLVAAVALSANEIKDMLDEPTFLPLLQDNIIRSFNDPWTPITRQDFRNFAYRFPLVFNAAPMWAGFVLWAEFINLNEVNQIVSDAAGTGNTAECDGTFARVGRTPYQSSTAGSGNATISYADGGVNYSIYIATLGVPLSVEPNTTAPFNPIAGNYAIGGGISLSSIVGASTPWKSARVRVDNNSVVNSSNFDGFTEYISVAKNLTEITGSGWTGVLDAVKGYLGDFTPDEDISATVRTITDGICKYNSVQTSIPADNGATVDWVFIVSRLD